MTPQKTYNLKLCFLTIGGQRIEGFGEDEAVSFEERSDTVEPTTGADGQHTVSVLNDDSMIATITVMENSRACQILRAQQVAQKAEAAAGSIIRRPFGLTDSISGDRINDDFCTFMNEPGPNKARTVGTREFRVFLPNAKAGMQLATNVTA